MKNFVVVLAVFLVCSQFSFAMFVRSGYQDCRDSGRSHIECKKAQSGYQSCLNQGRTHEECLKAKAGYLACRNDGLEHKDCLKAGVGYGFCRWHSEQSHEECLGVE